MVLLAFVELGATVVPAFTGTRVQHLKLLTCASILALSEPCRSHELDAEITELIEDSPFHGESYRKMWARLRHKTYSPLRDAFAC